MKFQSPKDKRQPQKLLEQKEKELLQRNENQNGIKLVDTGTTH